MNDRGVITCARCTKPPMIMELRTLFARDQQNFINAGHTILCAEHYDEAVYLWHDTYRSIMKFSEFVERMYVHG